MMTRILAIARTRSGPILVIDYRPDYRLDDDDAVIILPAERLLETCERLILCSVSSSSSRRPATSISHNDKSPFSYFINLFLIVIPTFLSEIQHSIVSQLYYFFTNHD